MVSLLLYLAISHGVENYFPRQWGMGISYANIFFIFRRALAREGDYEMMRVCACVH